MTDSQVIEITEHLQILGFPLEHAVDCPWLAKLEASFGRRLPEPYRSLLEFYRFRAFDVPGFESFSNLGDGSDEDITVAPFKDPAVRDWLIPRGFLQIGRPDTGSYDPVCLDMRTRPDAPAIVRFDHEDILLNRSRIEPIVVAESFSALVLAG
ncbi:SMI1/KNR4 family protein [Arenimonas oryziterrae]|uniref:Knr4/Smi1-like domain-containing protein n=1 Tax=Arenimonas oryziterrae DSM 21050 = YC6267 TaxID=1121015 RepID=A0A091AQC4_9GAMM|nr:SMI1/KNR4 family protein [Arenimonas oryziterrae]KFN41342.1 hypothetical protein N789_05565 [Arenimonas oryziterrae DSM 21050 = YC6267]